MEGPDASVPCSCLIVFRVHVEFARVIGKMIVQYRDVEGNEWDFQGIKE